MKTPFATLLSAIALTLSGPALAQDAAASYPNKPVRIVVGYQAGGPTDLTARLIASKLQTSMGQSFIVENKPGAGSNLASDQVAASAPDGYTLLIAASQLTWNSVLYSSLKFDAVNSFSPVSEIMTSPAVLVVGPTNKARTVAELVSLAKESPGKLNFASTGNGSVPHLAGELFQSRAKVKIVHIPYRGAGPAMNDLMGGQVDMYFMTALTAVPHIQANRLRALAVTSSKRLPQLPNVPTMAEAGIQDVELDSWNGLLAPAGTPKAIVDKLHREVEKALAAPEVRKTFEDQAATVVGSSPAEFSAHIKQEVQRGAAFVKSINLRLE